MKIINLSSVGIPKIKLFVFKIFFLPKFASKVAPLILCITIVKEVIFLIYIDKQNNLIKWKSSICPGLESQKITFLYFFSPFNKRIMRWFCLSIYIRNIPNRTTVIQRIRKNHKISYVQPKWRIVVLLRELNSIC